MTTLIGRKFHVSYSVSGATRLMHWLGFSPQVLAQQVAERDEAAVRVRQGQTSQQGRARLRRADRRRPSARQGADRAGAGPAQHPRLADHA
ncbi:winged helix-turn-helix domain-containing protein [Streptomyces hirsutus]|uniref:helix-turn-helix domain-containing protein n=1 Tax=Streptomyces hirsutus TaxID=35620 RepID=UPI003868C60B|nr:winged helix-turn-helix domain-containing protein [Streptomyces hirsutus]